MFRSFLPLLQVLLVFVILTWDVVLAARIANVRALPRSFVLLSALAGFFVLPALIIHLAATSSITGRAIISVDFVWPLTVVLFALQALYAAARRLVNPFLGFFIATYDIMIAIDAVLRYVSARGTPLPYPALIFLAATTATFTFVTQSPLVLGSPFFFFTPMIAPAFPALRRSSATFRLVLAVIAGAWVVIFLTSINPADQAVNSYAVHDPVTERLQERPAGDFDIGLKVFEDLNGPPAQLAVKNDLALADTLGVTVVNVVLVPEAMDRSALDSLARVLDIVRNDSTEIMVTLGYAKPLIPIPGRTFNDARRLRTLDQIVRRLRPDVILPAQDPYDAGTRAAGQHGPEYWESYLERAAALIKRIRPRTRIGVAASAYDSRDSALYAWAAAKGSPIDVVGFTLLPSPSGVRTLDAERGAADRWMRVSNSSKDHWIFASGGYPEAHGEQSQERAIWAALAWGTSRPSIKGLVVWDAGDYGIIRGLRAADGHFRRATFAIMRAMKGLRESAAPAVVPPVKADTGVKKDTAKKATAKKPAAKR
jgi:hypothetical protein